MVSTPDALTRLLPGWYDAWHLEQRLLGVSPVFRIPSVKRAALARPYPGIAAASGDQVAAAPSAYAPDHDTITRSREQNANSTTTTTGSKSYELAKAVLHCLPEGDSDGAEWAWELVMVKIFGMVGTGYGITARGGYKGTTLIQHQGKKHFVVAAYSPYPGPGEIPSTDPGRKPEILGVLFVWHAKTEGKKKIVASSWATIRKAMQTAEGSFHAQKALHFGSAHVVDDESEIDDWGPELAATETGSSRWTPHQGPLPTRSREVVSVRNPQTVEVAKSIVVVNANRKQLHWIGLKALFDVLQSTIVATFEDDTLVANRFLTEAVRVYDVVERRGAVVK
eukprot:g16749.t1